MSAMKQNRWMQQLHRWDVIFIRSLGLHYLEFEMKKIEPEKIGKRRQNRGAI